MRKTKLILAVAVVLCTIGLCGCHFGGYSFKLDTGHALRNVDFGYSKEQVLASEDEEPDSLPEGETGLICYLNLKIDGLTASIVYNIDEEKGFVDGGIYFVVDDNNHVDVYNALAEACKSLYGDVLDFEDSTTKRWILDDKVITIMDLDYSHTVAYNVREVQDYLSSLE